MATTAVRGAVRVAIYKDRDNTKPTRKFWATCDCGWLSEHRSIIDDIAREAADHLVYCNGSPDLPRRGMEQKIPRCQQCGELYISIPRMGIGHTCGVKTQQVAQR